LVLQSYKYIGYDGKNFLNCNLKLLQTAQILWYKMEMTGEKWLN